MKRIVLPEYEEPAEYVVFTGCRCAAPVLDRCYLGTWTCRCCNQVIAPDRPTGEAFSQVTP